MSYFASIPFQLEAAGGLGSFTPIISPVYAHGMVRAIRGLGITIIVWG
ncbi:hypothetical protein CAG54_04240 [Vibrio sp. V27_P1S3P104]|nr:MULTISPECIES: hypothetical protein [Vibrio]NAX40251.1 hypothetical protein [Vibrio sp. V26_P1S5P106]NAW69847.1 hypothetical protein [Vibrio sp. V28_P6S34P95]NAX03887.1 hypothetical protein [Vibrio sp. V30_P3S12P165]NAX33712.1 hypothetical protein [Vibrio sp. V29_P1S30P107]NAX36729.1 hypothetical protein [Vibrio sp. V27_P1S3P104]